MSDSIDTILRRTKEKVRQQRLHRQISALEAKLERVKCARKFNWQNQVYRLTSKLNRLNRELAQPELFL